MKRLALAVALPITGAAAWIWKTRRNIADLVGGTCIVIAATLVSSELAWAVAGVGLLLYAARA